MTWFDKTTSWIGSKAQRLGQKVSGGVSYLGDKVGSGVKSVYNWGVGHAGDIRDVAGKISGVAGSVGKGAVALGGLIASTGIGLPLAGLVEGVGAGAMGLSKVAGGVGVGAGMVQAGKEAGVISKWN